MNLNELAKKAHENAVNKGFYEKPLEIGTLLMLVVSELGEALSADQHNRKPLIGWYKKDLTIKGIDLVESYKMCIKDTFEDEISDAMIILLGICHHKEIDIEWHIEQKMKYNEGREYLHGKAY